MAVADNTDNGEEPITIKKYANRRLYNTATSSYVTLDHLCAMVKEGTDFQVMDAKTGEDITRSVLTQIIFEEESKGHNLLPIQFLRQLIQYYGDSMQSFLPSYLEMSLENFKRNQDQIQKTITTAFGSAPHFSQYEDQIRQNVKMFENTIHMFSPFTSATAKDTPEAAATPASEMEEEASDDITRLKEELIKELEAVRAKLEELTNK
jgi:polyhydroxyalkanoate synthesis repressor PhaR